LCRFFAAFSIFTGEFRRLQVNFFHALRFQTLYSTNESRHHPQLGEGFFPSLKAVEMSRKEALSKLREVLLVRREALRKALAGDLSLLRQIADDGGDVIDVAADTAQDEISSQLVEVESRELGQIEEALLRLKDGRYGDCDGCDKPIPLARLQAVPYATQCITCARQSEKVIPRFSNFSGDSTEAGVW
jgi:DnaK suppressor protein